MSGGVLVTGGAGFLGSHLVEALVARGERVAVVDNLTGGSLANLDACAEQFEWLPLDVGAPAFTELVARRQFDTIYHLAGNSYVPPSVADPEMDFTANVLGTFQLLECLRRDSPGSILLNASSAAVYGSPRRSPITETFLPEPISPYGASKLAAEQYVRVYAITYGLRATSLRYFSMYGPRQRKQVVFDILEKIKADPSKLLLLGTGKELRDMSYVSDSVDATLLLAERGAREGDVYNIATGSSTSIADIADQVCKSLNVSPTVRFNGSLRLGDPSTWVASTGKIRALGVYPRVSLAGGIAATVAWFKREVGDFTSCRR